MKNNLAREANAHSFFPLLDDTQTVGSLVEDKACLCISADTPIETVLAMMTHMETRIAAVIDNGNVFKGIVNRSSLLGGLMIQGDFDVGSAIDTAALKQLKASDVMTAAIPFLATELSIHDAAEMMAEHGFNTMPVLGDNAQFVGIADIRDLSTAQLSTGDDLMSFLSNKRHSLRSFSKH